MSHENIIKNTCFGWIQYWSADCCNRRWNLGENKTSSPLGQTNVSQNVINILDNNITAVFIPTMWDFTRSRLLVKLCTHCCCWHPSRDSWENMINLSKVSFIIETQKRRMRSPLQMLVLFGKCMTEKGALSRIDWPSFGHWLTTNHYIRCVYKYKWMRGFESYPASWRFPSLLHIGTKLL